MPIGPQAFAHLRITVNDIERSRDFYDAVFWLPIAIEMPADAEATTRENLSFLFGGVTYQQGDALFGLRPVGNVTINEDRTGLDHMSFAVADRAALEDAAAVLEENGVRHRGSRTSGPGGSWSSATGQHRPRAVRGASGVVPRSASVR